MPYDSFNNWAISRPDGRYDIGSPYGGGASVTYATMEDHVPGSTWPTWENRRLASDIADRKLQYDVEPYGVITRWDDNQAWRNRYNRGYVARVIQPTCMMYLTNTKWGHNKFYRIFVHNEQVLTQYGRIGRKGTVTRKTYGTPYDRNRAIINNLHKRFVGDYEIMAEPPAAVMAQFMTLTGIPVPEKLTKEVEVILKKRRLRNLIRI